MKRKREKKEKGKTPPCSQLPRLFLTANLDLLSLLLSFNINIDAMDDLPEELLEHIAYENQPRCLRSEFSSLVFHLADTEGVQHTRRLLMLVEMGNPRLPLAKGNTTHQLIKGLLQNPQAEKILQQQYHASGGEEVDAQSMLRVVLELRCPFPFFLFIFWLSFTVTIL